ncbi:MAG TPA: hypothetical protein VGP79_09695 [Bryobacteraceae bacterium]|jgi:ferric-dicitrate binding protein FerR (iron transport regulator)|nr:hypothetical protein [Bryobacteraceae bacterium]
MKRAILLLAVASVLAPAQSIRLTPGSPVTIVAPIKHVTIGNTTIRNRSDKQVVGVKFSVTWEALHEPVVAIERASVEISPGGRATVTVPIPPGQRGVQVEIAAVEFADGSTWTPSN